MRHTPATYAITPNDFPVPRNHSDRIWMKLLVSRLGGCIQRGRIINSTESNESRRACMTSGPGAFNQSNRYAYDTFTATSGNSIKQIARGITPARRAPKSSNGEVGAPGCINHPRNRNTRARVSERNLLEDNRGPPHLRGHRRRDIFWFVTVGDTRVFMRARTIDDWTRCA